MPAPTGVGATTTPLGVDVFALGRLQPPPVSVPPPIPRHAASALRLHRQGVRHRRGGGGVGSGSRHRPRSCPVPHRHRHLVEPAEHRVRDLLPPHLERRRRPLRVARRSLNRRVDGVDFRFVKLDDGSSVPFRPLPLARSANPQSRRRRPWSRCPRVRRACCPCRGVAPGPRLRPDGWWRLLLVPRGVYSSVADA